MKDQPAPMDYLESQSARSAAQRKPIGLAMLLFSIGVLCTWILLTESPEHVEEIQAEMGPITFL